MRDSLIALRADMVKTAETQATTRRGDVARVTDLENKGFDLATRLTGEIAEIRRHLDDMGAPGNPQAVASIGAEIAEIRRIVEEMPAGNDDLDQRIKDLWTRLQNYDGITARFHRMGEDLRDSREAITNLITSDERMGRGLDRREARVDGLLARVQCLEDSAQTSASRIRGLEIVAEALQNGNPLLSMDAKEVLTQHIADCERLLADAKTVRVL